MNTISKFQPRHLGPAVSRTSAAPGLTTTSSQPVDDQVTLSCKPETSEPKLSTGKWAAVGAAAALGLVALGAATPASAHHLDQCWQTTSYTQSDGWNTEVVQESYNVCTGEQHFSRSDGYGHQHHGHGHTHRGSSHRSHRSGHQGHHQHHDHDSEVGAFFLGVLGGILLSQ